MNPASRISEGAPPPAGTGPVPPTVRGIKYVAPLPPGGYAEAAKRAVLGLARSGVPVTFMPLVPGGGLGLTLEPYAGRSIADPDLAPLCNLPVDYDTVVIHAPPELYPPIAAAEEGRRLIGSTVWETDRIPEKWHRWLDAVDRIIVPCRWNKEVFEACGVRRPVHVVPHICEEPPAAALPRPGGGRRFAFYSIGVWSSRKGMDHLVRAYLSAFGWRDKVELVIKTNPRDLTRLRRGGYIWTTDSAVLRIRWQVRSLARIRVITGELSAPQMRALHARGDCYVSLPHGEGWGLGCFDAAAAGNPVVTTGHGGMLDYLGSDNPWLVRHRVAPSDAEAFESEIFSSDQKWAMPDEADAAQTMRRIFEQPGQAREAARALQGRIRSAYHWRPVTGELMRVVAAARGCAVAGG